MKRLTIQLDDDQFRRLQHLARAIGAMQECEFSVRDLGDKLFDHLDQAIYRSGSWERDVFERMFEEEAMGDAQNAMYAAGDQPLTAGEEAARASRGVVAAAQ